MQWLLYLAIGCVLVMLFHSLLWGLAHLSVRAVKWVLAVLLIIPALFIPALRRYAMWGYLLWPRGQRASSPGGQAPPSATMEVQEARQILGVERGADRKTIEKAYRDLMRVHHPDQGGNAYFAKKINEAREVLLNQRDHA